MRKQPWKEVQWLVHEHTLENVRTKMGTRHLEFLSQPLVVNIQLSSLLAYQPTPVLLLNTFSLARPIFYLSVFTLKGNYIINAHEKAAPFTLNIRDQRANIFNGKQS